MSGPARHVTLMLHREGALRDRSWRIPVWLFRTLVSLVILVVVGLLAGVAFYVPLTQAAIRVPGLERRVAELEAENSRIVVLAEALDSAEARYVRIRELLGVEPTAAGARTAPVLPVAPAIRVTGDPATAPPPAGPSAPSRWPLDEPGYMTRGRAAPNSFEEEHPGIDIAMPAGRVVRAAGGGVVLSAGRDDDLGLSVILAHPDDLRSIYGHMSRLTVSTGDTVPVGAVLGLTGNTGRSSAPHLHFEIRRGDRPLDPLTFVQEDVR